MDNEPSQGRRRRPPLRIRWNWLGGSSATNQSDSRVEDKPYRPKATLGILSDKQTDEVPGK